MRKFFDRLNMILYGAVIAVFFVNCEPSSFQVIQIGSTDLSSTSTKQFAAYSIKTDWAIYPEPPLPPRPTAGVINFDQTFGTPYMRVTDETDGANCGTRYSYYPTFNLNNTMMLVGCDQKNFVIDLDPVNFRISNKREIPNTASLIYEDAHWSGTNPDIFYIHNFGSNIYEVNARTGSITLSTNVASVLSTGGYMWQMSKTSDDRYFAFTKRDASYGKEGYAVVERGTNRVILNINATQLDEVQIDKSGKYLLTKTGLESSWAVDNVKNIVWDLTTKKSVDFYGREDRAVGHSDMGTGFVVGHENWDNSVVCRTFANPKQDYKTLPVVVPGSWDKALSNGSGHYSMLAKNEGWILVSSSDESPTPGLMRNELTQVATDGSKKIRRLLHHRGIATNYENTPRGNISFDGQFLAYTSNWGNTGRTDLYIAKIPPAEERPGCGN